MGPQSSTLPTHHLDPSRAPAAFRLVRLGILLSALCIATGIAASQTLATTLPLLYPSGIVFDSAGNLYFSETASQLIRKVTPAGVLTTIAGTGTQGFSGDNGPALSAQLDSPSGLAIDSSGNLYLADTHNHRIRRINAATSIITTIAGTGTPAFSGDNAAATSAALNHPTALALDSANNLYVADTVNHRIRRIASATGIITTVAGDGTQGFSGDGGPATSASIDSPAGLAVDSSGNLYLADTRNHRIRQVSASTGHITTLAGSTTSAGGLPIFSGDNGPASSATLALPRGLTLDVPGNLYLADTANHRIRRIATSTGTSTITTVAGQGTEGFAGDGGPAVLASLDSPRSVALSPAGLLTLADTGNARVRQLDQLPTPGPDIHTLAGIGLSTPGLLTLSAPSVVAYGSGTLTATLTTSTLASGTVTFLDATSSTASILATSPLTTDSAAASTSSLSAGTHQLTAIYSGDSTHSPAQSSALTLTVTPLTLTATPNPATILYGQPIPILTGTLTGVLPQDSASLTPSFLTTAAPLSPTGTYLISTTLTGPAASNYVVQTQTSALTIAPAPTVTTFTPSTATPLAGVPVTFTLQAITTTSGTPTGTITLLDNSTPLVSLPAVQGAAIYTTSTLALGPHLLSASYSGDTNFLPSKSAASSIAVTSSTPSDFTLTPTSALTQSIPSGSSATYTFSVTTQGPALSSPITLALAGVPTGATSSMNPAYIPPGGGVTAFSVTIQTPKLALSRPSTLPSTRVPIPVFYALLLPSAFFFRRQRNSLTTHRRTLKVLLAVITFAAANFLTACGTRINTAPEITTATATYTLTITATSTTPTGAPLQHSAIVTLQVL